MSQSSTYVPVSGGGGIVTQIDGDVGSAVGPIISLLAEPTAGSSVTFSGTGTTMRFNVTDLNSNTIVGNNSGNGTISGTNNTSIGKDALTSLTSGSNNIAVGIDAMNATTAGSGNIVIGGGNANLNDIGSNNIVIGYVSLFPAATSNVTVIGNSFTSKCAIGGINGISLGNTATVVTMGGTDPDELGTAVITAGTGISITPSANTITIAATGPGSFAWSIITANQTAAVNNGYICNKAGTLALALPATSSVGDIIEVTNQNTALGIQFTQSVLQQILLGNSGTTIGATGTLTSSAVGDSLKLVCITANLTWRAVSGWGNWTTA